MGTTRIILLASLLAVSSAVIIGKKCDRSGEFLQVTVEINTEGDTFEYITFKNAQGTQLRNQCGSENGDFTGTGTAADPFQIAISVNASVDMDAGTPDCGHVADGEFLTWILFIMYEPPPFPGAVGRTIEQSISCNFTEIVQEGSVGVSINNTAVETFQTVRLHHISIALEFRIVKESFQEYGPSESYTLADNVRLRLRAVNNITGLYGFNCKACNTPHCDQLVFPILDSNGCKFPEFTSILGAASANAQPSNQGTFMIANVVVPNQDFSIYAGMAFSEEFQLFRFIGGNDVYFTCSVGYCSDPNDPFCTQHCREVIGARRKRRDIRRTEVDEDYTITVVKVLGDNKRLTLGYPDTVAESAPKEEVFVNVTVPRLARENCLGKAQYITVFAVLGTVLVGTSVAAAAIGAKLVTRKSR